MPRLSGLLRQGQELSLRAARGSQAFVIATTDRLGRNGDTGSPRPLGRVWATQLNLAEVIVGEPVTLADEAYRHLLILGELHREFVQRLFEAIDTRPLLTTVDVAPSNVIRMSPRVGA